MAYAIALLAGGLAAWLLLAVYETTWEDIFPEQ